MGDLLVERCALLRGVAEHLAPAQAAQYVDMRNHPPVLVHHEHLDFVLLRQVFSVRLLARHRANASRCLRQGRIDLSANLRRHHGLQVGRLDRQYGFRSKHICWIRPAAFPGHRCALRGSRKLRKDGIRVGRGGCRRARICALRQRGLCHERQAQVRN